MFLNRRMVKTTGDDLAHASRPCMPVSKRVTSEFAVTISWFLVNDTTLFQRGKTMIQTIESLLQITTELMRISSSS